MRWSMTLPRLLTPAVLTLVACAGCLSAQPDSLSDAQVETLLGQMREPASGAASWQILGRGRVLAAQGTARLTADNEGRFRLQFDEPLHFAEVHDGSTTWKLFPWGSVLDVEGREEELSIIPMWVMTGYWLSPDAPVVISSGAAGRQGNVVPLRVRHRDGQLPFEVLVDTKRRAPISVRPADVAPSFVLEMDDHRMMNGWPVAASARWLNRGTVIGELDFDEPRGITPEEDTWSSPKLIAQATFDPRSATQVEARSDGRGFLFVRPVINGRQMGWFLFDTGAPATILGLAAVEQLGLNKLAEGQSSGVGGSAGIDIHAADSIQVGPVRVGPILMASRNVLRLGWRDLPIEGILGRDVIGRAVVEYDVRSGWIGFHDPATYELPSSAGWQRILLHEGKLVARLRFEDHEAEFLVDTAAGGAVSISKPLVDKLDLLRGRNTQSSTNSGVGGSVDMRRGKLRWLEFGGTRYEDVLTDFAVSDQGSYGDPYPDGIVGISLIDDYRVVFDLTNRRMAFLDR